MTLATNISKTLLDITGEPRIEIAILSVLKDAVEHRIEKIEADESMIPKSAFSYSDMIKIASELDSYGLCDLADRLEQMCLNDV